VNAVSIDGVSAVLGRAGPCYIRNSSLLPVLGFVELDVADLAVMEASGGLLHVALHEIGHVLGIGSLWDFAGMLTGRGTSQPAFSGANAANAFDAAGGTAFVGPKVPVENTGGAGTRDAHWRESVFGPELMTGYLNAGANPLSLVTIASLRDLGYAVDYGGADPFSLSTGPLAATDSPTERLRMIELPVPIPVRLGPDGLPAAPPPPR
jgi:hypothetical protein